MTKIYADSLVMRSKPVPLAQKKVPNVKAKPVPLAKRMLPKELPANCTPVPFPKPPVKPNVKPNVKTF